MIKVIILHCRITIDVLKNLIKNSDEWKLTVQNRQEDESFVMKTATQTILYRQALIKYSEKYGVTKASIRYKTNRQYISIVGKNDMTELLSPWRISRTALIITQINIPSMSLSSYRICAKEMSIRVW